MKREKLKHLGQNLAVAGISFLVCFAALEIVLRLLGYGKVEIYEPDAELFWRLKPQQDCFTKVDHKPVHINSHGTRGPEFSPAKPADTLRILSLGDSRTFGWGLAGPETYSGLLERTLQESVGNRKKVEVINAGVNAYSFSQMKVYLEHRGLSFQPDFVLLAEANLWTQFSEKSSREFVKKFMTRVRLKNLLRRFATYHYLIEVQLKEVYERTRTRFVPVDPQQDPLFKAQQQDDPDAFFREAIAGLCRAAQAHGVKPVLVYIPTLTALESTNEDRVLRTKRLVSQSLNVPLVDLRPDLAAGKGLYLEGDPVHLNAQGNEIIARRLFQTMTNLLAP
ncbi:MAG: SGNH/GDSL hydrolase family protein [Verrucomicrobia bacterium]|nr:SGNH/GDSL hydrolase family protein [Verrucomicrobiota bacterium]